MEREKIIEAAKELCRYLIKSTDSSRFYCPYCGEANIPCGFSTEIVKVVKKALIPEGAVVLTKEEYEKLKNKQLFAVIKYDEDKMKEIAKETAKKIVLEFTEKGKDEICKEMAKEILTLIKNGVELNSMIDGDAKIAIMNELRWAGQKYGVEVKNERIYRANK